MSLALGPATKLNMSLALKLVAADPNDWYRLFKAVCHQITGPGDAKILVEILIQNGFEMDYFLSDMANRTKSLEKLNIVEIINCYDYNHYVMDRIVYRLAVSRSCFTSLLFSEQTSLAQKTILKENLDYVHMLWQKIVLKSKSYIQSLIREYNQTLQELLHIKHSSKTVNLSNKRVCLLSCFDGDIKRIKFEYIESKNPDDNYLLAYFGCFENISHFLALAL